MITRLYLLYVICLVISNVGKSLFNYYNNVSICFESKFTGLYYDSDHLTRFLYRL